MRRVVVTGLGIVSSIGNNAEEVRASLMSGTSGIVASPEMAEHGFRSRVAGTLKINLADHIDKRTLRFMGDGAGYAYLAMGQAIADAGLTEDQISNPRTGLVAGSGGPSTSAIFTAHNIVKDTGATKRIGPFAVPKSMSSTSQRKPLDRLQDQRHQLFHHLRLLNIAALYRQRGRADHDGQARHHCLQAAEKSSTGPCRACLTRWVP